MDGENCVFKCENILVNEGDECNDQSDKGCGWDGENCMFKCENITDDGKCVDDCEWDSTATPSCIDLINDKF